MTINDEFKLADGVRKSYLRHRGDMVTVIKETNLPQEFVEKVVKKFKKSSDWQVKNLVAETISKEMLLGRQSRIQCLMEELENLRKTRFVIKSTCCKDIVRELNFDGVEGVQYECLKCGNPTDIVYIENKDTSTKINSLIDTLRKEDELLTKFATSVGFFELNQPPTVIKNQQNILVMPGGELDEQTVKDIQTLSYTEQDAIRLKLEKDLSEAEVIEEE